MKVSKLLPVFVISLLGLSFSANAGKKSPKPAKPATTTSSDKKSGSYIRNEGVEGTVTAKGHEGWVELHQTDKPETTTTGNAQQVQKASSTANQNTGKTKIPPPTSNTITNRSQYQD